MLIVTIYDTLKLKNLGLFLMKLFLGVTKKVYHVLPANRIHETKLLSSRMILFPCIADLYVNITQLLVVIQFRNFYRNLAKLAFLDFSIRQKKQNFHLARFFIFKKLNRY